MCLPALLPRSSCATVIKTTVVISVWNNSRCRQVLGSSADTFHRPLGKTREQMGDFSMEQGGARGYQVLGKLLEKREEPAKWRRKRGAFADGGTYLCRAGKPRRGWQAQSKQAGTEWCGGLAPSSLAAAPLPGDCWSQGHFTELPQSMARSEVKTNESKTDPWGASEAANPTSSCPVFCVHDIYIHKCWNILLRTLLQDFNQERSH